MTEENHIDLSAQLKRIADHLGFLEKKLDTLLEQSQNRRPFNSGTGFSGGYQNRGYRPNRGNAYSSRHAGQQGPSGRYQGQGNRYASHQAPRPSHSAHRPTRHA